MTEYSRKGQSQEHSHMEMGKKNCCILPMLALPQSQNGLGWLEENTEFSAALEGKRRVECIASIPALKGLPEGQASVSPD